MDNLSPRPKITIEDFCNHDSNLLQDDIIKNLAENFVLFFNLKYPVNMDDLIKICHDSNIQVNYIPIPYEVRGGNCTYENTEVIYLKEGDSPCAQLHTLLHEMYEIIARRILSPEVMTEANANKFAANVLIPDQMAFNWIMQNGIDIIGFRKFFNRSYAAAILKINEQLCNLVFKETNLPVAIITLLYERPHWEQQKRVPHLRLMLLTESLGFDFKLRTKDKVKELLIETNKMSLPIKKLVACFSKLDHGVLFQNAFLTYNNITTPVDILIHTIKWKNYCKNYASKVIIQIATLPSRSILLNLAEKEKIPKINLEDYDKGEVCK